MGSDSDWPVVQKAVETLDEFGAGHEVRVISAHRTPELGMSLQRRPRAPGSEGDYAAAGGAAQLGGVLAAHTTLPVIGIPVKGGALNGLDALLATLQMPPASRWRRSHWAAPARSTRPCWPCRSWRRPGRRLRKKLARHKKKPGEEGQFGERPGAGRALLVAQPEGEGTRAMGVQQTRNFPLPVPLRAMPRRSAKRVSASHVVTRWSSPRIRCMVWPRTRTCPERLTAVCHEGRDERKPVAMLAASVAEVARYGATLDPAARRLAETFWPGPLTLVLACAARGAAAADVMEGFRVPGDAALRELLAQVGGLLRVTSANRSGDPPARTVDEAVSALAGHVGLALDGGVCDGAPSTVVRIDGDRSTVLREGAIAASVIRSA